MKKKTLLFDLYFSQPLSGAKFHGGGEYIKTVFMELVEGYSNEIDIIAFFNYQEFLDDWVKELIHKHKVKTLDIKHVSELPTIFEKYSIGIFYTGMPYHYESWMFKDGIYRIGTFHGMRAVECPHDQYEYMYISSKILRIKEHIRNLLKDTRLGYSKNRIDGINNYSKCIDAFNILVCDSEHTKFSLLNYFPRLKANDIEVLFPPLKHSENREKHLSTVERERFIFILGANRWIKNTYRGIKAIDDLYSRGHLKGIKTVVVGGLPNAIVKEIKNPKRFKFFDYVDDKTLEDLYQTCTLFLYLTLNEGFGYPPLEAMYYGKTMVVSSVCSIQEICGNVVYYVNPYDIGEIQNRILQGVSKPIMTEMVKEQFITITDKQKADLRRLCQLICYTEQREKKNTSY